MPNNMRAEPHHALRFKTISEQSDSEGGRYSMVESN
jgi:hypothetical protein